MHKEIAVTAQLAGLFAVFTGLYIVLQLGWFLLSAGLVALAVGILMEVVALKNTPAARTKRLKSVHGGE